MAKENIRQAFQIADCLDNARWLELKRQTKEERSLVNYHAPNPTDPEHIILSHWLTYICDRGMKYEQVWNRGGYVFSWLVEEYQKCKSYDALYKFLTSPNQWYEIAADKKCRFIAQGDGNDRVSAEDDGCVSFASRYIATDIISITRTLLKLKKAEGLGNYLNKNMKDKWGSEDAMKRLLFHMYDLSYNGIGQYAVGDIENGLPEPDQLGKGSEVKYEQYVKRTIFSSKRATCALRDYFKNAEFMEAFKALTDTDDVTYQRLHGQLDQLELPGDVWNNRESFGKCVSQFGFGRPSQLNKALREAYRGLDRENEEKVTGYPEQFDITFDFVPRMCEKASCNICLFAKLLRKKQFCIDALQMYCHKQDASFCPALLKYCGYSVLCADAVKNNACIRNLAQNLEGAVGFLQGYSGETI